MKPKKIVGLSLAIILAILSFVLSPEMIGMEEVKGVMQTSE